MIIQDILNALNLGEDKNCQFMFSINKAIRHGILTASWAEGRTVARLIDQRGNHRWI